jgi:hypothetical protein
MSDAQFCIILGAILLCAVIVSTQAFLYDLASERWRKDLSEKLDKWIEDQKRK